MMQAMTTRAGWPERARGKWKGCVVAEEGNGVATMSIDFGLSALHLAGWTGGLDPCASALGRFSPRFGRGVARAHSPRPVATQRRAVGCRGTLGTELAALV